MSLVLSYVGLGATAPVNEEIFMPRGVVASGQKMDTPQATGTVAPAPSTSDQLVLAPPRVACQKCWPWWYMLGTAAAGAFVGVVATGLLKDVGKKRR